MKRLIKNYLETLAERVHVLLAKWTAQLDSASFFRGRSECGRGRLTKRPTDDANDERNAIVCVSEYCPKIE